MSWHCVRPFIGVFRFGNIASTTFLEKSFGVFLMIISALLYAMIFGHMTTIIQQMTSATVR